MTGPTREEYFKRLTEPTAWWYFQQLTDRDVAERERDGEPYRFTGLEDAYRAYKLSVEALVMAMFWGEYQEDDGRMNEWDKLRHVMDRARDFITKRMGESGHVSSDEEWYELHRDTLDQMDSMDKRLEAMRHVFYVLPETLAETPEV